MERRLQGFTLIELMVTLAVMAILMVVAVPSFMEFRQRRALQGASDQLVSAWDQARFEALRRDRQLYVTLRNDSGSVCLGVDTGSACDCRAKSGETGFCDVSTFPGDNANLAGVTATANPTLGEPDTDAVGVAVIDPKRGGITDTGDWGGIALKGPPGRADYRLNFYVDTRGRAVVCEPSDAPAKIPAYSDRRCAL
jgi:prepilin-type N-terminal cleavage/methylation domain-containing protein